ncbi:hypothetical protein F5B18DRAFT_626867 [Nemania serpens]|nr:hypothetical protein F5B18DRAFT_626867 [Nemania serpens]
MLALLLHTQTSPCSAIIYTRSLSLSHERFSLSRRHQQSDGTMPRTQSPPAELLNSLMPHSPNQATNFRSSGAHHQFCSKKH